MEDQPKGDSEDRAGTGETSQSPQPALSDKKETTQTQADGEKSGADAAAKTPPKSPWERFTVWVWPMEFSDAVMILLTVAIAVGTLASAAAIVLQWREMVNGGTDTAAIKVAAQKQADAAQKFADTATLINGGIGDAVTKLDAQAQANRKSADAAKSAAETASEALHISERAFLILGVPTDDFQHMRITIPIINSGHIPSGPAVIVLHEATFRVDDPAAKTVSPSAVLETHWRKNSYQTIPVVPGGNILGMDVHLPAVVQDEITNGKQAIMIAAQVTYNDGFPNTPEQTYSFCDTSSYLVSSKFFSMRPCDDYNLILQALISLDKYPSPANQEQ